MAELRPDADHDAVCASAVRHQVVVAPPGTGKTCLSIRLAGELATRIAPASAQVLVVTFSNQARTQLEREADRQLPAALRRRVEVTNYHRFFWQGVHAYRRALGLPMRLDIGSTGRRKTALEPAGVPLVRAIEAQTGLVESLAEHRYPEFRDARTPATDDLDRLLTLVQREQAGGRLVFDDLGALFWELLERFPVLDDAYKQRFPMVIADEHQDASALQDAVVRRLGIERLVILADPMQLIHGFRGASLERLQRHQQECQETHSLTTAHRWHDSQQLAEWLLAVRTRLGGGNATVARPQSVELLRTRTEHGFNAVKPQVRNAVANLFRAGSGSVAVLARENTQVATLRRYLSQEGLFPRQIGGDFEEARDDIEQLPLLLNEQSVALHALERLTGLVPSLQKSTVDQVRSRLAADGVTKHRASAGAMRLLKSLEQIYEYGAGRYAHALVDALDACAAAGHNLPRPDSVRALRDTASALAGDRPELDDVIEQYAEKMLLARHTAPSTRRGLFVMTAHQAKGKEFDAVVLVDLSTRFWPDNADSRRLLYVAVTRATARWTIIAPDSGASPLLQHVMG